MKMPQLFFSIALVLLFSVNSFGQIESAPQQEKKPSLDNGTIKSQYEFMMNKSSRYQEYKVIKIEWLDRFESNIQDSLNLVKKNLSNSEVLIEDQKNEIVDLNNELQKVKTELEETINIQNSMSFLGLQLSKSAYNTIMWIIILGSLGVAGVCFFLFRRSNVVTIETKETLAEVRDEFETHRRNALVREQKLARKLQDEVIKNKNLGI